MVEAQAAQSHKDDGNNFFKAEMWLKAAACYTKGIKDNPEDPVLYRQATDQCGLSFEPAYHVKFSLPSCFQKGCPPAVTVVQHC